MKSLTVSRIQKENQIIRKLKTAAVSGLCFAKMAFGLWSRGNSFEFFPAEESHHNRNKHKDVETLISIGRCIKPIPKQNLPPPEENKIKI